MPYHSQIYATLLSFFKKSSKSCDIFIILRLISAIMAGEFKVQLLESFAALITGAFGLVAALAWNEAIKSAVKMVFGEADDIVGMLVYAVIVTILAVGIKKPCIEGYENYG